LKVQSPELSYFVSRAWCKTIVTTLFDIRSYNSFAPSHRYITSSKCPLPKLFKLCPWAYPLLVPMCPSAFSSGERPRALWAPFVFSSDLIIFVSANVEMTHNILAQLRYYANTKTIMLAIFIIQTLLNSAKNLNV